MIYTIIEVHLCIRIIATIQNLSNNAWSLTRASGALPENQKYTFSSHKFFKVISKTDSNQLIKP
jgi:hypothetical protein